MFKEYSSRPVTRLARAITGEDKIEYNHETKDAVVSRKDGKVFKFQCAVKPVVGDYLIYQNEARIAHQPKAQFEANNVV